MSIAQYEITLASLCAWREARGEGIDGIRAVLHVIRNRTAGGQSWSDVICRKWQFSSMTAPGDSQLILWPLSTDPIFDDCLRLAELIYEGGDFDLTNGATHYFNPGVVLPDWAAKMKRVAVIGHHDFYR